MRSRASHCERFGVKRRCPSSFAVPGQSGSWSRFRSHPETWSGSGTISGASLSGIVNTRGGNCPKHGSREPRASVFGGTSHAMWCSFSESSRCAHQRAGTQREFTVSARAWERTMGRAIRVAGGMRCRKHLLFPLARRSTPVASSGRPVLPNPSIERTCSGALRAPTHAAHVELWASRANACV
jgi:hypothetical protein